MVLEHMCMVRLCMLGMLGMRMLQTRAQKTSQSIKDLRTLRAEGLVKCICFPQDWYA